MQEFQTGDTVYVESLEMPWCMFTGELDVDGVYEDSFGRRMVNLSYHGVSFATGVTSDRLQRVGCSRAEKVPGDRTAEPVAENQENVRSQSDS